MSHIGYSRVAFAQHAERVARENAARKAEEHRKALKAADRHLFYLVAAILILGAVAGALM